MQKSIFRWQRKRGQVRDATKTPLHTKIIKYLIDQVVVHVLPTVLGARDAAVAVKHAEKAALDAVRHVRVPVERRVGNDLRAKKVWGILTEFVEDKVI